MLGTTAAVASITTEILTTVYTCCALGVMYARKSEITKLYRVGLRCFGELFQ